MSNENTTVGITHMPHDPTGVTYYPRVWMKLLKQGKINVEMNALGLVLLPMRTKPFDASYILTIPAYRDRDVVWVTEHLEGMVEAGLLIRAPGPAVPSYSINPKYIYDPETDSSLA